MVKNVRELFESSTAGYKAAPDPVTGFIFKMDTIKNGKGSKRRPTDPKKWSKGFDQIKWKSGGKRKVKTK